jgi:hypothetical protein
MSAQLSLAHGAAGKIASVFRAGILISLTPELLASLFCTGDGEQDGRVFKLWNRRIDKALYDTLIPKYFINTRVFKDDWSG